jgi:hypothetical protein
VKKTDIPQITDNPQILVTGWELSDVAAPVGLRVCLEASSVPGRGVARAPRCAGGAPSDLALRIHTLPHLFMAESGTG